MENNVINTPIAICIIESTDMILQRLIRCNCITFEKAIELRKVMIEKLPELECRIMNANSVDKSSIDDIRKVVLSYLECTISTLIDSNTLLVDIYWIDEISRVIDDYTNILVEIGFVNKADSDVLNRKLNDDIMLIRHASFKHSDENSIGNYELMYSAISNRMLFITRISRRTYGYVGDDTITGDRIYVKQLELTQRNSYIKYLHDLGISKADMAILFNVSLSTVRRALN